MINCAIRFFLLMWAMRVSNWSESQRTGWKRCDQQKHIRGIMKENQRAIRLKEGEKVAYACGSCSCFRVWNGWWCALEQVRERLKWEEEEEEGASDDDVFVFESDSNFECASFFFFIHFTSLHFMPATLTSSIEKQWRLSWSQTSLWKSAMRHMNCSIRRSTLLNEEERRGGTNQR